MTGADGPITPCPIADCDRSFASPNAAAQHVHRSGGHPEVDTWEQALDMVDGGDGGDPDPEPDADDDPTVDGRNSRPEAAGGPECPECGGRNLFDASQYTSFDLGCRDCSDASTWEVFDRE